MFERFTKNARVVVVHAQEMARERRADEIRTEHTLLALFHVRDTVPEIVFRAFHLDPDAIAAEIDDLPRGGRPAMDPDALSALGIDLDEVRRMADEAFGPGALDRTRAAGGPERARQWRGGHIPFSRTNKKALELALRESIHFGHNYIGTEHLLLGLLRADDGAAHDILVAHGVRLDTARAIVEEVLRGREAG